MAVLATAGHVDHGKSTLVRALTGQDPDRLEEEHRRGLSIELGYVWTRFDDLGDRGDVAFVDVPGHQRFITTTLAGVGPVPVVLFVVAADDPWMPQAAEHLAALDALGVATGSSWGPAPISPTRPPHSRRPGHGWSQRRSPTSPRWSSADAAARGWTSCG